ncbi:SpoIIE family protein phosphatase/ATP-binding protein [Streptomyces sp. Ru73]|uniref:SpoIIE family protein phosphatase/ATP-binding protein n=1 Tax=Streptomyces sp. Ru73 TaxID=2080748 RepID=UPI0015E43405|nr:SpoIIE family protein phosphatase/ATP-binding protein [Streptomyces sp. Ru73]
MRRIRHRARPRSLLSPRSLAGQVFVLQVLVVVLLVVAAVSVLALQAKRDSKQAAERRSQSVAETFAASPAVARAMDGPHPTAVLEPQAERVRKRAGVDYLVVFNLDGIRLTHPDRRLIGKHVVGAFGAALEAAREDRPYTEIVDDGPLGPAVDSTAPVRRTDGSLVGMVSAGITLERAENTVDRQMPVLLGAAGLGLALAAGSTALVSRRLRRQTHGLGQAEMTRMYEHHDAVLHAVREGVVILGPDGRLVLVNDEARRLLDLPERLDGRAVDEVGLPDRLVALMRSGRSATDEVHHVGNRLLAVNVRSTDRDGGPRGSVTTLRDTTELTALTGRAEVARERLQLLYESGVRIGTTLDVVRTAEELAEVAVPRFADIVTVDLLEAVTEGDEPSVHAGWRMRRTATRGGPGEPGIYPIGEVIHFVSTTPQARALETGRAALVADLTRTVEWSDQDRARGAALLDAGVRSLVTVPLRARGVVLGMANFWRSEDSPPFEEEDLSFAEEVTARAAVCIDNARRYAREHAMAVTLQRSLLPRGLPEQDALEVAWRYLPAQAGVGGDWFDVIPLPGARVALVVGDVVGHGLHAAATMGRLRTAVHNFSTLDLPVDELLGHLDELVTRIDSEEGTGQERRDWEGVTGATCLYAIYDSVTGRCTVARAGHPGPALVGPDGRVSLPDVPPSPPLGLGGHPFETTELRLTEGTDLVLFTDGLVEDRGRDIDTGLAMLGAALEGAAGRSPDEMCRAAVEAMVPERPSDDIALLIARTRLLPPTRVAEWEVAQDPAEVGRLRAECGAKLREWGLADIGFSTELILSELVTNAIRYGAPPVRLRLLRDRTLICEVADGSSTAPHLRRATSMDEGGRGLFLVAHLAQRWGTRYTPGGKVIWTEQPLNGGGAVPDETPADVLLDQFDDSGF